LFDQGPIFTQTGTPNNLSILQNAAPVTYCTLGATATGAFRLADDFTIPAGQTWQVNRVVVFGYQTGATAPSITSGNLRILSTSPGLSITPTVVSGDTTTNVVTPANVTLSGTARVTGTTLTATNRLMQAIPLTISPAVTLTAGTYWVDFQAAGSVASGPFFPPLTTAILTAPASTGNALQLATAGAAYVALAQAFPNPDCLTTTVGPTQGVPFIVEGTNTTVSVVPVTPTGTAVSLPFTPGGAAGTRAFAFVGAGEVSCTVSGPFTAAPLTFTSPGSTTVTATGVGTGELVCSAGGAVIARYPLGSTFTVQAPAFSALSLGLMLAGFGLLGLFATRRFS
jgi:hypothetical protein